MKKTLVRVDNLQEHICQSSGKFYADDTIILTPGARDELSKKGISIVYGAKPETGDAYSAEHAEDASCAGEASENGNNGLDRLLYAVAGILKEQYGMTDPAELKTLSRHVLQAIRKSI